MSEVDCGRDKYNSHFLEMESIGTALTEVSLVKPEALSGERDRTGAYHHAFARTDGFRHPRIEPFQRRFGFTLPMSQEALRAGIRAG